MELRVAFLLFSIYMLLNSRPFYDYLSKIKWISNSSDSFHYVTVIQGILIVLSYMIIEKLVYNGFL